MCKRQTAADACFLNTDRSLRKGKFYGVTVKTVLLLAVPPAVVTNTFPVSAPVGTVAVIVVPELTVKLVAFTPPNFTTLAPSSAAPVIETCDPTDPLPGAIPEIVGTTLNF